MKNIFITAFVILVNFAFSQEKFKVDGVVAVIGKRAIFKSDVQKQAIQYKMQNVGIDEDNLDCTILEQLMFSKLLSHQAVEDSLEVKESQVKDAVKRRFKMLVQRVGSIKKLEEFYKKSKSDIEEEMQDVIGDQLLAQKMQQEIISKVDITPNEVQEYFSSIPKDELPQVDIQVKLSQIVVYPKIGKKVRQEIINKLKNIKKDIEEGSSFKTKAVLYSEDLGSSRKGGEYKGVKRGQFVKPFEAVAFNLEEGKISEPFETQFGYHIVQVQKRKGDELDLRHILIKNKVSEESLQESKQYIDSIKVIIESKDLSFEKAVKDFSQDEDTKYNNGIVINPQSRESIFELKNLDKDIAYVVENLQKGEISKPIYRETRDKKMYVIYMVKEKIYDHTIDFTRDFSKIKALAKNQKQERISAEWIEDKINNTYIRLSKEYKQCKFKQNWSKK